MKTLWQLITVLTMTSAPMGALATASSLLPEAPADTEVTTLTSVETEADEALSIVTAKLNLNPKWRKLDTEDHGSFVQILLPGTIIPKPGTFYDGAGPYIKKVAAFQVTPSDGAIRLFTTKEAAKVRVATTAEVLGNRVIVTIDHKKLSSILPPEILSAANKTNAKPKSAKTVAPSKVAVAQEPSQETIAAEAQIKAANIDPDMLPAFDKIKVPTADHVVANTEVRTNIQSPAEQIKADFSGEIVAAPKKESDDRLAVASLAELPSTESPAAPLAAAIPATTQKAAEIKVGQNVPDLGGKLSGVAIFSALMLVLMGALYFAKPLLRRRSAAISDGEMIKMKTISSMSLAAKQRLTLVQVGNEQILLAISPDNVSYITTINKNSTSNQLSGGGGPHHGSIQERIATTQPIKLDHFTTQLLNPENDGAVELRRPQFNSSARQTLPVANAKPTPRQQPKVTGNRIAINPQALQKPAQRKSINIAIGDEGIKRVGATQKEIIPRTARNSRDPLVGERPLDDITRLIREKLKNLPAI